MTSRRTFLSTAALSAAALATSSVFTHGQTTQPAAGAGALPQNPSWPRYRPPHRFGVGGVQLGSGFFRTPDDQGEAMIQASWDAGVRYFDTSPWYGLGLSERRYGHFLDGIKPEEYVLSTKVGRLLIPDASFTEHEMWKGDLRFNYEYDYTAEGTRRSIEDSMQRMGVPKIDIVFIHDLSPDNEDMGDDWKKYMDTAIEGAMPELTRMREEGKIKAWGMGVNTIEPQLACMENADPDIMLCATQYSLMKHEDALNKLFPVAREKNVSLVIGAPLNSGFLAWKDRFNYKYDIPEELRTKRGRISTVAQEHGTDLRTAALQFTAAPDIVAATIPGARDAEQARQNVQSMQAKIPTAFWTALKEEGLIAENAPTPA